MEEKEKKEDEKEEQEKPVIIEFVDPIERIKKRREEIKQRRLIGQSNTPNERKLIEMESISKKQIRHDLEKVKFSVQQFGLLAYTPAERRKLERDRLIRLGAKAPKKEWKNYKALMAEKAAASVPKDDSFLASG